MSLVMYRLAGFAMTSHHQHSKALNTGYDCLYIQCAEVISNVPVLAFLTYSLVLG